MSALSINPSEGLIIPNQILYAQGRITLETQRKYLRSSVWNLVQDEVKTRSHPEHAPYGQAAREALQAAGVWERVQSKLVLARTCNTSVRGDW